MCTKYMLFYTAFIIKEHFQTFGEMVQKPWKIKKCQLFFVKHVCMLTNCRKKMKQNSCGNSYVFAFYDICVFLQISSFMWGRATALHASKVEPR